MKTSFIVTNIVTVKHPKSWRLTDLKWLSLDICTNQINLKRNYNMKNIIYQIDDSVCERIGD